MKGRQNGRAGEDPADGHDARKTKSHSGKRAQRSFTAAERERLLEELEQSGETQETFCARHGIGYSTMSGWKRKLRGQGAAARGGRRPGGRPRKSAPKKGGPRSAKPRSAEARRSAVQAFERSHLTHAAFARAFGISEPTLRTWLARYKEEGEAGLEPRRPGRPKGSGAGLARVAEPVRDEIERTKRRFPHFGLRRVRDFLRRFEGVSVSTGTVARTLEERGVERAAPMKKKRRQKAQPRRFERARPGELWQSDITSFVLARPGTRVYLVVFLDDFSRYVVSFGLSVAMRSTSVMEVLLEGIARYGKPAEVLTDQGPQYFTWRGKSAFQKLLLREGVRHVVARSHHPQTVGKCERLWETIRGEFWERARPDDLSDARARLAHYFAHYNFFRPHQGIGGLVPADRFFKAEDALRRTLEAKMSARELEEALETAPRKSVYLFGQIGDEQVSLVGERGELVVQTSSGVHTRLGLDELGAPAAKQLAVQRVEQQDEHVEHVDVQDVEQDEQEAEQQSTEVTQEVEQDGTSERDGYDGRGAGDEHRGPAERGERDQRIDHVERIERIERGHDWDSARGAPAAAPAHGQEAAEVQPAADLSARSARAVAECDGGGAGWSSPDLHPDPDAVARQAQTGGGGGSVDAADLARVAALAASPGGHAGGPPAPAPSAASQRGHDDGTAERGRCGAEEAPRGEGARELESRAAGEPAREPAEARPGDAGQGGAGTDDENRPRAPQGAPQ